MKRLFTIAVLTISLLALLAACGKEATPTATPGLAQPTAQDLKQAAQELWETFSASANTRNAAPLHGIFIADIRERCTVEQMQETLWSGEGAFPDIEVRSVFLDLEDPSRALMQLAPLDQPEGNSQAEGNLQGIASGFAFSFPFPLVREEGEWRLGFPILGLGSEEGCPFAGSSSQEEQIAVAPRQLDATPQPAFPRLAPPSGVRSIGGGSGGGRGEYNASVLLVTDMTLAALLDHYRQQVFQPDWKVQQETMDEGLAALTWTLRDEANQPWLGVLLTTPAEEGTWVRLWLGGGAGVQTFVFPEGPDSGGEATGRRVDLRESLREQRHLSLEP